MSGVVYRLGRVIEWVTMIVAVFIFAVGVAVAYESNPPIDQPAAFIAVFGAVAVAVYLVGRAARYVLAGE